MKIHRDLLRAGMLFGLGLMLRVGLTAGTEFDGLYGQDSYAYHQFAVLIPQMLAGTTPLTSFFWPLGYPALLAGSYSLFGTSPLVGQTLNVLLGTLLAPAGYALARQIGLEFRGATLAGLLLALSGQVVQSSIVLMSDIPALTWATGSAILLMRWMKHGNNSALAGSGLLLGMAIITRWVYILLIPLWCLNILQSDRLNRKAIVASILPLIIVLIPQLVYQQITSAPGLQHDFVSAWSPAHAFQSTFNDIEGHFEYAQINLMYYLRFGYDPYFASALFIPLLLIGIGSLWRQRRWRWLAGWGLIPFIFLTGITHQNPRFLLILSTPTALLTGAGLDRVLDRTRGFRWQQIGVTLVIAVGTTQMIGAAAQGMIPWMMTQQQIKSAAIQTVSKLPIGARVYTFSQTMALRQYGALEVIDLYELAPETLAAQWRAGQDDFLLVNVWELENQWADRSPQIAYHWLRDRRGIELIARYGNFKLFRVKG